MRNISDLRAGQNNVDVIGEVSEIEEPKQVLTRFGTQITLVNAKIKDETGDIKITLWGKQSDGVEIGKKLEIKNGFVKEFRNELQLGVGKRGSIIVID